MFARDRTAKAHDKIGRLAEKTPPFRDALLGAQTEIPAAMDAAIAKMAVERAVVAIALGERVKLAQIVAGAVGGHRGILPTLPGVGLAGHKGGGAEPCFAHLPDALLRLLIADQFARDGVPLPLEPGDQAFGAGHRLLFAVAAEFGDQPAAALGQG